MLFTVNIGEARDRIISAPSFDARTWPLIQEDLLHVLSNLEHFQQKARKLEEFFEDYATLESDNRELQDEVNALHDSIERLQRQLAALSAGSGKGGLAA